VNESNKCFFVTNNTECLDPDALVNYLTVAYCSFKGLHVLVYTVGILWLLVMFVMLGNLAEKFFCPALEVTGKSLRLSQNVAGVTFVALGNSSADIFSALAGVNQSRTALVFGGLFGSGLFTTCMVGGVVMILTSFQIMERPFLRDVIMYLSSTYWAFCLFYMGSIGLASAIGVIVIYVLYLVVVIGSHNLYQKFIKTVPPPLTVYYDMETDCLQTSTISTLSVLKHKGECDENTALLPGPAAPCPITGYNVTRLHRQAQPFLTAITPVKLDKWRKASWYKKIYDIWKAPLVLLLKLTIPAVRHSKPNHNWCRTLNALHLITGPVFIAFAIGHTKMPVTDLVSTCCMVAMVGAVVAGLVLATSSNMEPPYYHNVFAYLGFFVSMSWIYVLATEIVTLLKAAGVIFNVGDTILGMTILAWGNCIPDMVTIVTISVKGGYPRMGLAACFGGPVLNLLLGLGIPFTMVTLRTGEPIKTEFDAAAGILTAFMFVGLISSLIVIPLMGFRTSKVYGFYLVLLYLTFVLVTALQELGLLFEVT